MIHSPALLVLLALLATARLTRLVNDDVILDRPRSWLVDHSPDTVAYLLSCAWCASLWLGFAVAGATYAWHNYSTVQVCLLALAASWVAGVARIVVDRLDR